MAKMMTYKEANVALESSLTPDPRCICKKTAIDNHAMASNLTAYVDNRLVPASMVVLITYSIQFKDWDGTVLSMQTVRYGHTPTLPANPSRTGYTFTGWNPSVSAAYSNLDYTALYTTNSYTATFLDDNGDVFSTQTVSYGGYATAPGTNPSKSGYTFTGWSPNPASTLITSNTTFTPQYTANSYTIRFLNYDGTVLQSSSVNHGVTPTYEGATPYKGQYQTFIGWSPSITAATQNLDYIAQFRDDTPAPTEYTIEWKYKYPNNDQVYPYTTLTYPMNGSYVLVLPSGYPNVDSGYDFPGWESSGAVAGSIVSSNYTYIVLCFVYQTLIVVRWFTWDQQSGGALFDTQYYTSGQLLEAPTGTPGARDGYTWIGWDQTDVGKPVTQSLHYYGQWEAVPLPGTYHTVTWRDQAAALTGFTTYSEQVLDGATPTAPAIPSRSGYTGAWYRMTSSDMSWQLGIVPVYEDTIYEIHWTVTATSHTVYYVSPILNDPYYVAQRTVEHGDPAPNLTAGLIRVPDGWRFLNWIDLPNSVTEDCYVRGLWKEIGGEEPDNPDNPVNPDNPDNPVGTYYTISWNDPAGAYTGFTNFSDQVLEGATPTPPSIPSRSGYTGVWDPEIVPATADATYTIRWTATVTSHTVTYIGPGGDVVGSRVVEHGAPAPDISPIIPTGWQFNGWVDLPSSVTSDCNVYGNWERTLINNEDDSEGDNGNTSGENTNPNLEPTNDDQNLGNNDDNPNANNPGDQPADSGDNSGSGGHTLEPGSNLEPSTGNETEP